MIVIFFISLLLSCPLSALTLGTKIPENKSFIVFTDRKVLLSLKNQSLIVPYSNIELLSYNEVRNDYVIIIKLKEPLDESPFFDKNEISFSITQKNNDILRKIIGIREKLIKKSYHI